MISLDSIIALNNISDLETALISVERCAHFEKIEPEQQYTDFYTKEKDMVDMKIKATDDIDIIDQFGSFRYFFII